MADLITIADDTLEGVQATRQRTFWDTITVASGANAAGTYYDAFTNVSTKTTINSNLTENGRLPLDWSGIIYRVRIAIVTAAATVADGVAIIDNGLFEFYTDENDLRLQAPVSDFPAGGGGWNSGQLTGSAGAAMIRTVNGVPSQTSAPALNTFGQIALTAGKIFRGRISFPDAQTASAAMNVRILLDTKLYRPVR
ncbi:MAG: hypothetical protein VX409_02845 [Verrucomicrobiota bacterium]|nr:hypothetical protein [Verrucomicrobiota bacterium]